MTCRSRVRCSACFRCCGRLRGWTRQRWGRNAFVDFSSISRRCVRRGGVSACARNTMCDRAESRSSHCFDTPSHLAAKNDAPHWRNVFGEAPKTARRARASIQARRTLCRPARNASRSDADLDRINPLHLAVCKLMRVFLAFEPATDKSRIQVEWRLWDRKSTNRAPT